MIASTQWKTLPRYHELTELVQSHPQNPDLWIEYGKSRNFRWKHAEAFTAFREAVRLAPDYLPARMALGCALASYIPVNHDEDTVDPEAFHREALDILQPLLDTPGVSEEVCAAIISALLNQGLFSEALSFALETLRERPDCTAALWNTALNSLPKTHPGMSEVVEQTLKNNPSPELRVKVMLYTGCIRPSPEAGVDLREMAWQEENLATLEKMSLVFSPGPDVSEAYKHFMVNRFADSPRGVKERLMQYYRKSCPELEYISPLVAERLRGPGPEKIRVGFAACRTWDVDFASVFVNLLERMDRKRFTFTLFFNDSRVEENPFSRRLRELLDEIILCPASDVRKYRETIANAGIDVLLHENVGGAGPVFTGFSRLAAVQCVFLDCPVSTCTPHEDYMIQYLPFGGLAEQRSRMREKLALFPSVLTVPSPGRTEVVAVRKTDFGIPETARFVLNWQAPHRWRPEDDEVVETLLQQDPHLWFLLRKDASTDFWFLWKRWSKRFSADIMRRIRTFTYLPLSRLYGAMQEADALLPSPSDTGWFSTPTAVGMDCPIVGYKYCILGDGLNMNCGINRVMGIPELIAETRAGYVEILQRLLYDQPWKEAVIEKIRKNKDKYFDINHDGSVDAFQEFITRAHERARNGLPPAHWEGGKFVE